jgi:hypothetical protein
MPSAVKLPLRSATRKGSIRQARITDHVYSGAVRPMTAKLADRLLLLSCTVILAARQYSWPSSAFWTKLLASRGYIVVLLIATIGIVGALTPFESWATRRQLAHGASLRRQILVRFGRLLMQTHAVRPKIDLEDLGLHIWRIKRSLQHPVQGRLARVATYRLASAPTSRAFTPARGVGVVGLCWAQDAQVGVDVADLRTRLVDESTYDAYRTHNGDDSVMGLSWTEFQRLKHRGAVFASPIRNGRGRFVGCVSLDASHGYATLATADLWREINAVCDIVAQDGFRNV